MRGLREYDERNERVKESNMSSLEIMKQKLMLTPIEEWDVSSVTDMYGMFWGATSFNQNLEAWGDKLHPDVDVDNMFEGSGLEGREPSWYLERIKR